jgi:nucleoid-associated protein YgaU
MSEYDRRLHTTLFGEPHNLALVLDPVAQTMAWYGWTISSLSSPESPSPPVGTMAAAAPAGPKRAAVAALVVLGMTAAGAGGYWLSDRRGDRGGAAVSEQVRSLSGRLQQQQASNERVRATLDQARQAVAEEAGRLQQLQGELDTARRDVQEARRELRQARHAVPRTFVLRYRVQPGDSLWELARTFYGDPSQWTRILDANRDRIRAPDRLAIGQVLKIPLTA